MDLSVLLLNVSFLILILFTMNTCFHKEKKKEKKKLGYFNLETKSVSATISFSFSISFLVGDWL